MIVKTFETDKIKNTNTNFFLLYGENEGHKSHIISSVLSVGYKENIIRYEENEILNKTDIFAAEVNNKSFFDDKKIIIISRATDRVNKILEEYFDKNLEDTRIIVNAGILDKKSKLRNNFEKKKNLICMPFYSDNNSTLIKLASSFFRDKNISISQETINVFVERCRGNRENLNNELSKIESFTKNKKNISIEDITKLTNLHENYSHSELCDQCLIKNIKKVIQIINENNFSSEDCIAITRIMMTKIKKLLRLKEDNIKEKNLDMVLSNFKPPIFWKDKEIVKSQILKWNTHSLSSFLNELNNLELILKKNSDKSLNILIDFLLTKSKTNN
tara:strand:+ start:298 stop:1290 length:993 start_codon:yes stop_codon:yes gene_type:complete